MRKKKSHFKIRRCAGSFHRKRSPSLSEGGYLKVRTYSTQKFPRVSSSSVSEGSRGGMNSRFAITLSKKMLLYFEKGTSNPSEIPSSLRSSLFARFVPHLTKSSLALRMTVLRIESFRLCEHISPTNPNLLIFNFQLLLTPRQIQIYLIDHCNQNFQYFHVFLQFFVHLK